MKLIIFVLVTKFIWLVHFKAKQIGNTRVSEKGLKKKTMLRFREVFLFGKKIILFFEKFIFCERIEKCFEFQFIFCAKGKRKVEDIF